MQFRFRWIVPIIAGALAAPILTAAAPVAPCADFRYVEGVGMSCRLPDGRLEVFSPDGRLSLGFTHGPDAARGAAAAPAAAAAKQPACVAGTPGDYYALVIYARAFDDTDDYAGKADSVRTLVQTANGMLSDAAAVTGDVADFKVHCTSGVITVRNATLPTPKANDDFSTITTDLMALGYSDPKLKYWVYYDDTVACGCSGIANFWGDDRLVVENASNGNASQPLFALTLGTLSATTMLHELSHTLGAVQNSSPSSTGAGHCTDGADVMCYQDGGPRGGSYNTTTCATMIYDCNKNDYFNASPPNGNYLATHWNIGSRLNRYVQVDDVNVAPVMAALSCPPKGGVGNPFACSFRATDASTGIFYTVDWGDGTSGRVPSSGAVKPNVTQTATHAYPSTGTRTINVTATDNESQAKSSAALAAMVQIVSDRVPPVLTITDPKTNTLHKGCAIQVPYAGRAAWQGRACIIATVTDDSSGVAGIAVYMSDKFRGSWGKAPFRMEFDVWGPAFAVPVRVEARDYAGNVTSTSFLVDVIV